MTQHTVDPERAAFLEVIAETPEDEVVRRVYADWLDEHDEPEEADFMRGWSLEAYRESKAWMEDFVERINLEWEGYYQEEGEVLNPLTLDKVIEGAHKHLNEKQAGMGERSTICLSFDTPDFMYPEIRRFWQHFQVFTSRCVKVEGDDPSYGSLFPGLLLAAPVDDDYTPDCYC